VFAAILDIGKALRLVLMVHIVAIRVATLLKNGVKSMEILMHDSTFVIEPPGKRNGDVGSIAHSAVHPVRTAAVRRTGTLRVLERI